MILSLRDISENTGKTEKTQADLGFRDITVNGVCYPVTSASPVNITVENTGNKNLSVSASGEVQVVIPCDRCLKEVQCTVPYDVTRKLDMKQTDEQRIADLDEISYLAGTNLDVDRLVYLEVLMNWPVKVLCKEDCKGICSRCGKDLNLGPCGCADEPKDPRMAAISDIFSKFKEV